MEQSEYLKNLMRRLEQASEPYHDLHDPSYHHSLSTIKFEREELDSNYNHSKRDPSLAVEANNETLAHGRREEAGGPADAIDNTKTSRNSPTLKFNAAKIRKRSEDKFDRELSRRSGSSRRGKGDLVEVRDRLIDIVSFLNAKIDGNPEVAIQKVVDLDFVKESLLPKQPEPHRANQGEGSKGSLLYLPKFQLHDAKLVKSSEILNNLSQEYGKADNQFLNLKHSFDKLNDIHSSHSLHQERPRPDNRQQQTSQQYYRPNKHIPQISNPVQLQPTLVPQNQSKPLIYINGRLNNSNSQANINFPPPVKQIRPLSEVPSIRYIPYSPLSPHSPHSPQHSNSLSKVSFQKAAYQPPVVQQKGPFAHPPALNLDRPPTFRTITSRPLSTQRLPLPAQPVRIGSPVPHFAPHLQTQKISLSSRIVQQELAQTPKIRPQQSRLKKKVNSSQHFKQEPLPDAETPKRLLTEGQDNREAFLRAEEQMKKIQPPKPYTKFSSTSENPFKASESVLSGSKKSSKFKADISYDILKSIAEQSEQNQPSKNLQASGRSSGRMMSSVHEVTPTSELPKLSKFLGGSTKLKRKGIDVSSSKKGYLSQYSRQ